jgi:hypothetical protein
MAITQFGKDMNIISNLSDAPNVDDGLTAAQLKAKFDEGGKAIKEYINDTLIPAIPAMPTFKGLVMSTGSGFALAEAGKDYIAEVPASSITKDMLGSDVTAVSLGGAVPSQAVPASLSGWANKTVTVKVAGVTADNHVIVTPHHDSYVVWAECLIRATAQGNGELTFKCEETPSETVKANVLIVG